jgi:hypothetical protein
VIPDYIEARLRRPLPRENFVVPGSTPVIAFGNFAEAEVATLGLNPSRQEFLNRRGQMLEGSSRRFETFPSLGVDTLETAPTALLERIIEACRLYFQPNRNPYMAWFGQLEALLKKLEASYLDGSACHLDLVQWATDPTWARLPESTRVRLVSDDAPFLLEQLHGHRIRLLLLNGTRVISQFVASTHCALERRAGISWGRATAVVYAGVFDGIQVLGWSPNLQSSYGVTNALRNEIAERLADVVIKG